MSWQDLAKGLGYQTEKEMWEKLYAEGSLGKLADRFSMTPAAVRKILTSHNIPIKGRGGPQAVKIKCVTPEMAEDIKARGVKVVAAEKGLSRYTLFRHYKNYLKTLEATAPPTASVGDGPSS